MASCECTVDNHWIKSTHFLTSVLSPPLTEGTLSRNSLRSGYDDQKKNCTVLAYAFQLAALYCGICLYMSFMVKHELNKKCIITISLNTEQNQSQWFIQLYFSIVLKIMKLNKPWSTVSKLPNTTAMTVMHIHF